MTETDAVETVAKARRLSLIKWKAVKGIFEELFDEIDKSCGFCDLGRYRVGKMFREKCAKCGVDTRCHAIQDVTGDIEKNLEKVIDGTIAFLEDMDVTEK